MVYATVDPIVDNTGNIYSRVLRMYYAIRLLEIRTKNSEDERKNNYLYN